MTPGPGLFARAFAAFLEDLSAADPAYVRALGDGATSPEALGTAWFAPRLAADPFDWAARNLSEAETGYRLRRADPWRSAFLRAHEIYEDLLPHFSEDDLERFHATLRPVFADNYASVPHPSIRRLLALRASGHLEVIRLGPEGGVAPGPGGTILLRHENAGDGGDGYDVLVDARGQQGIALAELDFPSLVPLWQTMRAPRFDRYDLDLPGGGRLHCLALPVLLRRHPFVQGLVNAEQMGRETAERLLAAQKAARSG